MAANFVFRGSGEEKRKIRVSYYLYQSNIIKKLVPSDMF